jgi:diguanylate cyclase (GGDEF)-like protein
MKAFQLPTGFAIHLIVVKLMALCGGFIYVALTGTQQDFCSPAAYWAIWFVLVALNAALFSWFSSIPERQERQFLISLLLDLAAICFLFFMQPATYIEMLVGLQLVSGFYSFVLPRSTSVITGFFCFTLYVFSVIFSTFRTDAVALDTAHSIGIMVFGGVAIGASVILVRKIRKSVDAIYTTTEELALDLSTQAVDSAITVETLSEHNRDIQTVLQVLENIVSVLDWDQLFENIVIAFKNRFVFEKFSIYLFNEETGMLQLRNESGSERATGGALEVKPDTGVVGWCYAHGKGVVIDDVRHDARYTQFNERGKRIRSLACQPLIFRGAHLGVLCLDSEKLASFDERTFAFLESLAPLISIAVSNSLSYASVKAESHTDNLTGLNNHRGFMELLPGLLTESYRDNIPMGLMVIDIDWFKKVNDTYGHLVGNLILTELAEILRTFFRGSDVVARYGGEEFVVVLNGTPPDIAPRICEQLRRKVETFQFPISLQRDAFKQVTISIGLATTADTNLEPEIVRGSRRGQSDTFIRNVDEIGAQLIDNADQALYAAKRDGRNQVMLSHFYPVKQQAPPVQEEPASETEHTY